ncbi:MAG TPA: YeeE/YedE family protein [Moraxellaceae bacterium]|nr:YeeE/YedE family protein [Moraxellaceae bacterium]
MMNAFFYLAVLIGGALFGAGLTLATMIQPEVVLAFLRFQDWGLMLVLGSAVMITLVVYQLVPRVMKKPLFAEGFGKHVLFGSRQTLIGAAIFGVGWGLSGVCPGPAIAGLGTGNWPLLYTLAGLFAGAWLQGWWASRSR